MNKQAMQRALTELNITIAQLRDAGACSEVMEQLEAAGAQLEQEMNATAWWYVFDKFDCFGGGYKLAAEAATLAEGMLQDGVKGVHILHLTEAQKDAYCRHGLSALIDVIGK